VARPSRWTEIVDVAAELFREKGFVATSLEDIAREVGMYKGSLYHYIASKEDLLFAVVREPAQQILDELRELAELDLPPSEKIRRLMRSHVKVLEENFTYASVYLEEVAGRHRSEEWSAMDREYIKAIIDVIDEGKRRGEFGASVDARITTLALIGSLNWLTHWYHPDGKLKGAEIADKFCDIFLVGMLSRSKRADD
jgi:TetR/AcrR family transcriptional regulator, cholesterol catabolism regulator